MDRSRGTAYAAGLLGLTVLSGCAGFGVTPVAPVTTAAPAPGTASPVQTPSGTPTATDGGTTPPAETPGASPTATPTQAPTQSSTPSTSPQVATMTGGNGSAQPLLVPTSALPSGWTATAARDTRGYRMTVCGVDLEPTEPVDGAQQNWQSSAAGPYLEQHVRVYPDDTATKVTGALAEKIPACKTYTAKDSRGGQSTFTVEKLSLQGAPSGTVAWRQRVDIPVPGSGTGTASPAMAEVVQDIAVKRTGAAVVLLNTYAVEKNPDDTALVEALKALG